jgi:sn-glycerol 3-phosphate transport system ATP-binding protein
LQRELRTTALYVTHDQVEAMTLADRMIVMNEGRAEQIGVPLDVYAEPATRFVAGFIGSPPMNFLSPAALAAPPRGLGDGMVLGIRPEHLWIGDPAMIRARASFAEALGAETLVHLTAETGEPLTVRQDGALPVPAVGETVGVAANTTRFHLFGADGRRAG